MKTSTAIYFVKYISYQYYSQYYFNIMRDYCDNNFNRWPCFFLIGPNISRYKDSVLQVYWTCCIYNENNFVSSLAAYNQVVLLQTYKKKKNPQMSTST